VCAPRRGQALLSLSKGRRRRRLEEIQTAAQARVARLRAELESDPGAGDRRRQAAQQRAAREQQERAQAALDRMAELEAALRQAQEGAP